MRILVVDDDSIVLASCERILAAEGYDVTPTGSSRVALEVLERERFDLVLVDIKMPEYDGFEFTRAVRRGFSGIPIIAMSGYPTEHTIEEAFATGAQRFIPKPFLPEELIQVVRSVTAEGR